MSKKVKVPLIIVIVLVCLFLLLVIGLNGYFKIPVISYYLSSEKSFEIPDLGKGFTPQGLTYSKVNQEFLITGYMANGDPSAVYVVEQEKGTEATAKKVILLKEDATPFAGHNGGLAVHGDYVYVAGDVDCCLYVYSYPAIRIAKDGEQVECLGCFPIEEGMRIDFVSNTEEKLIVGEFYMDGKFDTPKEHHGKTSIAEPYFGLAYGYEFSDEDTALFGLKKSICEVYALPDKAQGMAIHDGRAYVSTSYAFAFSDIYVYSMKSATRRNTTYKIGKQTVPFYEFDSGTIVDTMKFPPMAEEIEFVDDQMLTMCESACNKYILGKFYGGKWCYSTKVEKVW